MLLKIKNNQDAAHALLLQMVTGQTRTNALLTEVLADLRHEEDHDHDAESDASHDDFALVGQ